MLNSVRNASQFSSQLRPLLNQLDSNLPAFNLNAKDLDIITHPQDFYTTLLDRIDNAKERIFLTSLYLGKDQTELLNKLTSSLDRNKDLKLYILMDYLRCTRDSPKTSTASVLSKLTEKYGSRVDVRLYHTPNTNKFWSMVLPSRFNEGLLGLQHMKFYGFDDDLIISGANLSQEYFQDRQDRYYHFRGCHNLCDYYFNLQSTVSRISYKILPDIYKKFPKDYIVNWPSTNATCEPYINSERFVKDASLLLTNILTTRTEDVNENPTDTVVYPISQLTPILSKEKLNTEKSTIFQLLSYINTNSLKWVLTTGYFNMYPPFMKKFLTPTAYPKEDMGKVICASPQANSFYKSKGFSKHVPEAYLHLVRKFIRRLTDSGLHKQIGVYEWQNGVVHTPNGWSYHAKGLWIYDKETQLPNITVVGSTNYTKRSYSLDLENNLVLVTNNLGLQKRLQGEVDNLLSHTTRFDSLKQFDEKYKVPYWVKTVTDILGSHF
ncbi:BA75_01613T0 [Komagataella pastoris]|uniref:CDP-diacylglycerol--glycerol-3-phosphate 3-phosphatidyltransferase n=1 Tax=Komagataella pastoris TaxID=4922 RepID=A0A1B2J861_PICPA|nr:BA75_01613T0 [Komagataella pastoris]